MLRYGLTEEQLDILEKLWKVHHGRPFEVDNNLLVPGDLRRALMLRRFGIEKGYVPTPSFKKHNHYDTEDLVSIYIHYRPEDCRTWPYYPITMPLRKGRGPVSDKQCDEITWEVWDRFCNSVYSSKYLPDAINEAMRLNKEVFS